jgi:hypothetical protein
MKKFCFSNFPELLFGAAMAMGAATQASAAIVDFSDSGGTAEVLRVFGAAGSFTDQGLKFSASAGGAIFTLDASVGSVGGVNNHTNFLSYYRL